MDDNDDDDDGLGNKRIRIYVGRQVEPRPFFPTPPQQIWTRFTASAMFSLAPDGDESRGEVRWYRKKNPRKMNINNVLLGKKRRKKEKKRRVVGREGV